MHTKNSYFPLPNKFTTLNQSVKLEIHKSSVVTLSLLTTSMPLANLTAFKSEMYIKFLLSTSPTASTPNIVSEQVVVSSHKQSKYPN